MFRRLSPWGLLVTTLLACGGGADGLGAGGTSGLQPFAISAAANPATATEVHNLLEAGDRYRFEPSNAAANGILDNIWAQLVVVQTWTATARVLTYQFFNDSDPHTHWGRAYRYTGAADNYAGPIRAFTAGTYTRVNGSNYPAVILEALDGHYAADQVLGETDTLSPASQSQY